VRKKVWSLLVGSLLVLGGAGCASRGALAAAPQGEAPPAGECTRVRRREPSSLRVFDLYAEDPPVLEWRDESPPDVGDRFVIVDTVGYVGLAATTGEERQVDCYDDCPRHYAVTRWIEKPTRPPRPSAVALGPSAVPLPRARLHRPESKQGAWTTYLWIDLDGEGRADFEERTRECGCMSRVAIETRERRGDAWVILERDIFLSVHSFAEPRCADPW
jgi:hypothetical protein